MAVRRYVRQNADGGWDVLKEGRRRTTVQAETESRALARARDIVRREGAGEVRVVNEMGKVLRSATVSARSSRQNRGR